MPDIAVLLGVPDEDLIGPPKDSVEELADGTRLPHRSQRVYLNGKPVGEIEIHLHRRRGRDGKVDVSYGVTAVVYGPLSGGS